MNFEQVPKEISIDEVINNAYSLSPLMYKKVQIKNRNVRKISELIVEDNNYEKGNEPGSQWYVKKSNKYLIRPESVSLASN